jgi:hypothetical protein
MAYQVTISLNSAYTGTTQADDFTIVAKHANGSPSDDTLATGVTKAQLTSGVTYTVADTVTGGTVTSTGVCTNAVTWTGLNASTPSPTPNPTATPGSPTLNTFYITQFRLTGDPSAEFCDTNYTTTTIIQSEATTIPNLLNTMIYDEFGDPLLVANGRYAFVSEVSGTGSQTSPDPRYAIEVSNLGQCDDVVLLSCNGGGGPL